MTNDNRPFPIQAEYDCGGRWGRHTSCSVPWWLAEIAYVNYAKRYGKEQSLERLAERGGYGRQELIDLLAAEAQATRASGG